MSDSATPWTAAHQASLSFNISQSQLKLVSIESVMPSNYPTTLSSVTPFSSCPWSFPASGSFPMSPFFASDGQSIEASALASVLPMNIQGWFPLGLTFLISLWSKGFSRVFSSTVWKHQFFLDQPSLWFNSHICTWPLEKPALTVWIFAGKMMPLLFNMQSRFAIAFLPRSKHLLASTVLRGFFFFWYPPTPTWLWNPT